MDKNKNEKTIEDTYKNLSQRDHVLLRPDTYMGSLDKIEQNLWVVSKPYDNLENIQINKENLYYSPAFIKNFDEILTNASDHYWRDGGVKNIKINFDGQKFEIENDGSGIPVVEHKEEGVYVPELIFGNLLSGSNFDDEEERFGGGRNGLGAKIVNIMSEKFIIETADGSHRFYQEYSNNMENKTNEKITKNSKNFTRIIWYPDWKRFNMEQGLDEDTERILLKRIIDVAVYCPKVKIYYNKNLIPIKSIKDWMKMHVSQDSELFYEKLNERWEVGVAKTPFEDFEQVSIVNGISTYRGGTHVNKFAMDISKELYDILSKNKKYNFSWMDIKKNLFIFLIAKIPNPTFDTQTKEYLTNTMTVDIHQNAKISDSTLRKISKSQITQSIIDYIEAKEQQKLKRMNRDLQRVNVEKLIDAKSKDRSKCNLYIYEGESAKSAFRKFRDPNTMGAFPLGGKFKNVYKATPKNVLEDKEASNLMAAMGLKINEMVNEKDLRFNKIFISCDADADGDYITAQMISFFYRFWPELFDQKRVYKIYTPLFVAKKGNQKRYFYTQSDYQHWKKENDPSQWHFEYKKGLASLEDDEYREIILNPYLVRIDSDQECDQNLKCWFSAEIDKKDMRKERILKNYGS